MAKKDFSAEFNELIGAESAKGKETQESTAATSESAPVRRCTFILDEATLQRLHRAAYAETGREGRRITLKDVLTEALLDYFVKKGY